MLTQTFPSIKVPKPPRTYGPPHPTSYPAVRTFEHVGYIWNRVPTHNDASKAARIKITPEEFVRRDDIVHRVWTQAAVYPGDTVYPVSNEAYEEHGAMKVVGAVRTYFMFPEDEAWPETDNPFIVQLRPIDPSRNKGVINCTWNWFTKTNRICPLPANANASEK